LFTKIEEYMKLDRDARREHLKLDEGCIEIGGYDSREYRGLLAHFLKTTIPTRKKVVLCHGCNNHSCSNVLHLYWGTYADNIIDVKESGEWKSQWQRTVEKYGMDEAKELARKAASAGGKVGGGHNKLTEEQIEAYRSVLVKYDQSKRGWVTKAAEELKISHTHVRRFLTKYGLE
jgi:hypothetical protein